MGELHIEVVTNYIASQKDSLLNQYQHKIELINKKIKLFNRLLLIVSVVMLALNFL